MQYNYLNKQKYKRLLIYAMKNDNCSSGTILKQTWNTTVFVV